MYFILILILFLYIILSFIVGKRINKSINRYKHINSKIYWIIFTIISTSFIFYEFINKYFPHIVNTILSLIGSYYLSFLLYTLILFPIAFLLTKIFKPKIFDFYLSSLVIVFLIISTGTYLSLSPYVNNYEIHVDKPLQNGELKIVMVSDIHLGDLIGNTRLKTLINNINKENPDVVLIAGDLIDSNLDPVIDANMLDNLKDIKSKYGAYFSLGNHDFYTTRDIELTNLLKDVGITVLRDESILVNNEFYIIGRDDITADNLGNARASLNNLTANLDSSKLSIVIDHNPSKIDEAAENNIDLQVSGHTHRGQVFPGNLITKSIFPLDYGYGKFNNTTLVVSSGYGTWGPMIRTNSRSEIISITLKN